MDHDQPLVLIVDDPADLDDLHRQAYRIGHESIVGALAGGIDAWRAAGRPIEHTDALRATDLATQLVSGPADRPFVIDVRQAAEFDAGHVPGAVHIGAGALPERLDELPRDRPIAVMCASGYRASVASSILRTAGFSRVDWVSDGFDGWADAGLVAESGGDAGDATARARRRPHGVRPPPLRRRARVGLPSGRPVRRVGGGSA